ncbi:MAG: hypothetical protein ACRDGA_00605, partial [Bacteroidota bacterium]
MSKALFPDGPQRSDQALRSNLEEGFLKNPWYDPSLPSLVYENEKGTIAGFLGVTVRNMMFYEQPVRVATSQHMMVHPDDRSAFVALELVRTFLEGPQDLSMADMANDLSRKMWERLGGTTLLTHSYHWRRILRPARLAARVIQSRVRFTARLATMS